MGFFDLDSRWKIWIYRIGLIFNCFSLLGLIFIGTNANLHWGEDILKRKKNPKFNGKIEKFFYLVGWVATTGLFLIIILNLVGI
jgi:hypothetical protein